MQRGWLDGAGVVFSRDCIPRMFSCSVGVWCNRLQWMMWGCDGFARYHTVSAITISNALASHTHRHIPSQATTTMATTTLVVGMATVAAMATTTLATKAIAPVLVAAVAVDGVESPERLIHLQRRRPSAKMLTHSSSKKTRVSTLMHTKTSQWKPPATTCPHPLAPLMMCSCPRRCWPMSSDASTPSPPLCSDTRFPSAWQAVI